MRVDVDKYVARARDLFMQGYNCTQSVVLAFADLYDLDPELASKMVIGFGGGVGRMREVCGTASGMFFLAGLERTRDVKGLAGHECKADVYAAVQLLAGRFREQTGSLICRELLAGSLVHGNGYVPDERTAEYYRKRPCVRMVETAARIYAGWLNEQ